MRQNKRVSIAFIVAVSAFFLIAWNPLKPILNYFASVFAGSETSIPLPFPDIQVGITGKPSFSLNIQSPPGAGDVIPSIAINYTSGNNQSIVGRGWSLSGFPRISKNPSLGVHFGKSDGFSSSILGDLISTGSGVYRTKIESFYKATFDGTAWSLRDASGVIYEYGRVNTSGSNSIIQGDSGPIAFYLDKVRDSFGNGYDITYSSETLNSDEPLPAEIKYARGNARIVFVYSSRSSDWKEQIFFLTNNTLRKKVLSQIQVFSKDESGSEQLVDTYDLKYDTYDDFGPLLVSYERENYEPVEFKYSDRSVQADLFKSDGKNFGISYQAKDPSVQSACDSTQIACACTASWACIVASGGLAPSLCAAGIAAYQNICTNGITSTFVTPADMDGDGSPEIVKVVGSMTNQKFSVTKLSDWDLVTSSPIVGGNSTVGDHIGITSVGRILPGDFNGDGKSDFLVLKNNGDALKVYYGPDFQSESYSGVTAQSLGSSVQKHFVQDFNGDGKTDFIQVDSSNRFLIYLSTGSGFQKIQTLTISTYGTEFQQFVDLDRNGVPDFVRINDSTSKELIVTFLDYQSGLLQIIETTKMSGNDFGKKGDQFLSDLNGDGYPDFAFFSKPGSQGSLSYYPFTGRNFLTNGASPLQTINVNGTYANQESGSNSDTVYVELDVSGDGIKDRISYDNTDVSNSFFNVEVYDPTQSKYLTAFKAYWNQDVSKDLNSDGLVDTFRADATSEQQTDSNGVVTIVTTNKFKVTITNGSYLEVSIDLNSYIPTESGSSDSSSMAYSNWRNRKDFVDLNGDGRADFVRYDGTNSILSVSYARLDSNGYITYSSNGDDSWSIGGYMLSMDANGDGKPEILGFNANKVNLITSVSSSAPGVLTKAYRSFPYESNVEVHYIRFNQSLPGGLLTQIKNGSYSSLGDLELNINYQLTKNHSGANQSSLFDSSNPQMVPFTVADYVATKIEQKTGDTVLSSNSYTYSYARFYLNGLRNSSYIGFQKITKTDEINNTKTESNYDLSFLEMVGKTSAETLWKNGNKISESTNSYSKSTSFLGGTLVLQSGNTETRYQDGQVFVAMSVSKSYDTYGNLISKNTQVNGNTVSETTTYLNDWSTGVLGKPTDLSVYKNGELVSQKKINYSNFLVSEVKELVSSGVWRSQYIGAYDEFGNPIQVTDSNGNTTSIEYDSIVKKFPIKMTNSLGHVRLKSYDYKNGKELANTDPNGAVTKTEYDIFERPVVRYLAGESEWSEKAEYENTSDLENKLVRKRFRRADGESWQEENFNVLTLISKRRSSLINGYVLVEETLQDKQGQTIKKTDSYVEGSNPFSWTTYSYDLEGKLVKSERNDGYTVSIFMDGLNSTIQESMNGNIIKESVETKNSIGQTVSLTKGGKTIQYSYSSNGQISKIIDPENGITRIETNLIGKRTSVAGPDSGTVAFSYDPNSGNVTEQESANGSKVSYSYDVLGRVIRVEGTGPLGESLHNIFEYDNSSTPNGIGRLTKVTDSLGTTEFEYDIRGNQKVLKKTLTDENLTFYIKKSYNLQNQVEELTYPDGSIVKNLFSEAGYLSGVTLTPADGSGSDFPIVQYTGPVFENGSLKIQRTLGNGVRTDIFYDPVKKTLTGLKTVKDNQIYQDLSYSYDNSGNYSSIQDSVQPLRNQTFSYDSLNRITAAQGIYGSEEYQYSDSGKLLKKGNSTYIYGDALHKNAVTQVNSSDTSYTYSYDASGNVTNRNGDVFHYDPFQKLKQIDTESGETVRFDYDFTGTRIRKTRTSDGLKTITLGGLYEVVLASDGSAKHTLYFKGNSGDLVGQWTRTDADLISGLSFTSDSISDQGKLAWNTLTWSIKDGALRGLKYVIFVPGTNLAFLYIPIFLGIGFALLSLREGAWKVSLKLTTPVLLFAFSHCSVILPGGSGKAPWELLPLTDANTPGVGNPYDPGSGAGIPVKGFLFLHPDHLGSIIMATDGSGNRLTGGTQSGASNVSYKPYGEINRDDSYGPDVFRYKYTAQEEDRETGLYYYKARYYDPVLGRFLQADSLINSSDPIGMDQYMYTGGNPLRYTDPGGHSQASSFFSDIGLGFLNFNIKATIAIAILNPVGAIGAALGVAAVGSAVAMIAAATVLGLAVGASVIAVSTAGQLSAVAAMGGLLALGVAAAAVSLASAVVAVAGIIAVEATIMASILASTVAAAAILAGVAALAVASLIVLTALATALAVALVALAVIPILGATALAVGAVVVGTILSPFTLQAYIAGGYSKSSLNHLRWREKDARTAACYMTAAQIAVGGVYFAIYGAPGIGILSAEEITSIPLFGTTYTTANVLQVSTGIQLLYNLSQGNFLQAGINAADLVTGLPIGTIYQYGEQTGNTCGGSL
ncbi:RHS repeat-associated core domain-containing protein [Leptospira licerasiae]|uniref:RHS repeat-associated core domain-containing protein n=1 Tax=Leptospira licerasiae TaxID=447106 RepID=UPI0030168FDC